MALVKIHDGTKSSEHLCDHCVYSRSRTHDSGHVERQCTATDNEAARWALVAGSPVVECSVYMKSGEQGLNAMRSIAWDYFKNDDGFVTFLDQNARKHPQVVSRKTRWQRFRNWLRR